MQFKAQEKFRSWHKEKESLYVLKCVHKYVHVYIPIVFTSLYNLSL